MNGDRVKNKRLAALFLLGCVVFNYPLLSLFNINRMFYGLPLFYLYVFAAWAVMILLLIVITQRPSAKDRPPSSLRKKAAAR